MKAAVFHEVGAPVAIDDVSVRPPAEGEVRVAIRAAGLCHSDVSAINGTYPTPRPTVMGHEGAGVIESVGPGVRTLKEGDPVILSTLAHCGHCPECDVGRPTLCWNAPRPSTPFTVGGKPAYNFANSSTFSELTVVRASSAIPIPREMPMAQAALIGCGIITGVGAVLNRAKVEAGRTMAVFGAGGIGLNIVQGGVLAGARRIIAVDLVPAKLEWAERFGATDVIDARAADPVQAIKDLTGGRGADYAFEAVGNLKAIGQAFESLAPGGTLTIVGVPKLDARADFLVNALRVDRAILGCRYGTARPQHDFPMLAELYLAGRLKIDELITRHYALDDVNQAIEDLEKGELARGVFDISQ
ncbi:MAG TPA: Zn-dependent alcohol dehydrogenase [Candidatus Binatia bacterium]|nr:Zn-dependent alcohol dehydrogenase [Candidatus Binatia bacterium]